MGSCLSYVLQCCGKQEDSSQFGESSDRAQLIDPNSDNVTIQRIQSENYYCRYLDNGFSRKSEEHSDLNKILQEMASNVIDVASLGSYSVDQPEYRDRSNYYSNRMRSMQPEYRERMSYYINKMRSLSLARSFAKIPKNSILFDVPNPDKIFASTCVVSNEEMQSIASVMNDIDNILEEMNIGSFDDLIIPFQVQT
uniref:Ragulator complex protein LAMTOR1 n=1 Tax=Maconellicoccus hirsutus TaxID=177089 RepID=A2I3Y3_MACHI|nr:hypothetical protein [Maconellicoccus hirsutus]